MPDLPRLTRIKVKIVGVGVVLSSFRRPRVEPWSWLKRSKVDLGSRVEAVSLHRLEAWVQGLQGAKSQLG